ncbi:MAG: dihydrodipicolinate synthase family protein [Chitinophagaceae bacterium]|nr:dihydrodipicolinate synthase family protein [Chitinophagaceae bacterium]
MPVKWEGVMPAVTTKFDENGDLDLTAFEKNLNAQIDAGVTALILGGTLGESSVLEVSEKKLLVDTAIIVAQKRVPVILNIAEGSLREAIRQAALAEEWGAEGLMVLPPMRYKSDHRETVHWYKSIAKSTSLPILVYNNPIDYKTGITLEMFEEFAEHENIQAVKESTRDITNVTRMKNKFGNRFKILCGVDTLSMEELVMGADGLVAGLVCAFPNETVWLYKLVKQGRIAEATELYRWFMPLLELDIHPKLVQYIKLAESIVGLGTEHVREPRLPLVGEEREHVLRIINDAVAVRPSIPAALSGVAAQ